MKNVKLSNRTAHVLINSVCSRLNIRKDDTAPRCGYLPGIHRPCRSGYRL